MAYYAPPAAPFPLQAHSASDGVFGFARANDVGGNVNLASAATVVMELKNTAGAWVDVASKATGAIAWDAAQLVYFATLQSSVWAAYPAAVIAYRVRDGWGDGFDNILAFGAITLSDR